MNKEQQQVKDWMTKFSQETPDKPCIPSLEIRKLRAKLILEEALETIEALGFTLEVKDGFTVQDYFDACLDIKPDLIQIADGLADLHYVAYCGTAVACGIDMEPVFAEVHRSNMSKLWTELEKFKNEDRILVGQRVAWTKDQPRCWLVKNSDGKVIKSPSYSPANIIL
jgi:predicted HAD superfamily Cof-like phosphohydrolase